MAEAKTVLDEGFAIGALGKRPEAERHQRLLVLAAQHANEGAALLENTEAEAAADRGGRGLF
jgi:hypothetical protein